LEFGCGKLDSEQIVVRSQSKVVVVVVVVLWGNEKRIVKLEASQAFLTVSRENPANNSTISSQCCQVPRGSGKPTRAAADS
jgi:hypothetical protein